MEDGTIIQQDIQRITLGVVQNGFADGIADGREAHYQRDFNRGYQAGFAMAFKLGQHKGFGAGLGRQSLAETEYELKQQCLNSDLILKQEIARAHCQLCLDSGKSERQSLDSIVEDQEGHNRGIAEELWKRYEIAAISKEDK